MIKIIRKHKIIYELLVNTFIFSKAIYYHLILLVFSIFKINNNKIIVINYSGKGYWDSPKYISNELIKHNYKIYWATKLWYKESLPKGINYVKHNSIKYLYHLATSKIWINNCRFEYGIRKRRKQFYIQTRHACLSLKKVESAVEKKLLSLYVRWAKNDSKMANIFMSNSSYCTNFYKKYFRYDGTILEYWCPRNDIIINNDSKSIEKVKKHFWISLEEKIVLYAPTFRVDGSLDAYNINYNTLLNTLEKKLGGKWKLLIRLHPNVSNLSNQLLWYNKNIINASDYPDMQELLVATNFLITDYSSCILDYAISRKPWIIYASDIKEYKKDRDFEIKLEDTPFQIATNNEELKEIIDNYNITKYEKEVNKFYAKIGLKESGQSSIKIVELINKIL